MSQANRSNAAPGPRSAGGPPQGGIGAVSIDPVKLAKKYMWLLVAGGILGIALGIGAFFLLRTVSPKFTSTVTFEVTPPPAEPGVIYANRIDEEELERTIQTQVFNMTSETLLYNVASSRQLQSQAGTWCKQYIERGTFDQDAAFEALQSAIRAAPVRGTYLIKLRATAGDKQSALALAAVVRSEYLSSSSGDANRRLNEKRDGLNAIIRTNDSRRSTLIAQRENLVNDGELDSIDASRSEARSSLEQVNVELLTVQQDIQAAMVSLERYEEMLVSDAGIQYTDQQRAAVEQDPLVQSIRSQIKQAEVERNALARSVTPEHRAMRQINDRISSLQQQLSDLREEKLRELFDAELDGLRTMVGQLRAQESELQTKAEALRLQLTDLNKILITFDDIKNELESIEAQQAKNKADLASLDRVASEGNGSARVRVVEFEREPKNLSFPRLEMVVPAGVIIVLGIISAFILLREVLDQSVRSASDIAMIARATVLGVIPEINEDPSAPDRVETAFRDQPRGATAEAFRQLRTSVLKTMHAQDHRSLMIVSGLPGSGATSVAGNFAAAAAAAEEKTLLIDANFRRPAVDKVMGVSAEEGLGDVLAGDTTLDSAVRTTNDTYLDVLSAGTEKNRIFERLGASPMSALLAAAGEKYDLVILDVSPAIVSGDALALANRCDASILVVRAGAEKRGMVARLRNELNDARAQLLGIVVNGVRSASGGYLRENIRTAHTYHADKPGRAKSGRSGASGKTSTRERVESDA